ncbi:MAG: ATP-binding protein [Candidatus Marinimicrobia bacterium]|nr:ATP-binding protein [Candidatus Neomarinimicrobiota bacterium]
MKIAIASGKGGTGKTTLSTNLAHYLATAGNVVLTDLDVEEPNSGLFIHGKTIYETDIFKKIPLWKSGNCLLCNKCKELCNFNAITRILDEILVFPQLCHSCHACSELCPTNSLPMENKILGKLQQKRYDNLDFVESRLEIGEEQAVPLIAQTIDFIDEKFHHDYLKIFDSPPGTSCPMIEAVKDADFVILITEPTPFGFHDVRLAVEVVRKLKKNFGIIINRYGIGNNDVEEYCNEHHIPLLAKIPNQQQIAKLYSEGQLLWQHIPEVKRELDQVVAYLQNEGLMK